MPAFTVCMIVRNEEKNVRKCLRSLSPLQSEIVVVDTGSGDRTVSYAKEFTDKVFSFSWINDFSAARNFAASKASNPWILAVDCDEFLVEAHLPRLQTAMEERADQIGMITRISPYTDFLGNSGVMHEFVGRLYDQRLYHYEGKIHENVTSIHKEFSFSSPLPHASESSPNDPRQKYFEIPLAFYHGGYQEKGLREKKAERDLSMLQDTLAQNGPDAYTYFQMGKCYVVLNNHALAAHYFELGLATKDLRPSLAFVQEMVESYGYCLLELKQYQKALQLQNVYDDFAKRADFCFLMGLIYMNNAMFQRALFEFEKATKMKDYSIEGTNTYSAWYNMGVIYEVLRERETALSYYRKCGSYSPARKRLDAMQ